MLVRFDGCQLFIPSIPWPCIVLVVAVFKDCWQGAAGMIRGFEQFRDGVRAVPFCFASATPLAAVRDAATPAAWNLLSHGCC